MRVMILKRMATSKNNLKIATFAYFTENFQRRFQNDLRKLKYLFEVKTTSKDS